MIFARATSNDGKVKVFLLGLSRGNIDRLIAGRPILMTRDSHGDGIPEGWAISLLFGETEADIVEELKKANLLSPETVVRQEPRLGQDDDR